MATTTDDTDSHIGWFGSSWGTSHDDDSFTPNYYDATFHASTNNGDYCIIEWYGTDITVYGARRDNHGIYGISVDSASTQYYSGYASDPQLQQVLFATTGLTEGDHKIKISNENARNVGEYPTYLWLDIDKVTVNGQLLNAAGPASQAASSAASTSTSSSTSSSSSTISSPSSIESTLTTPSSSSTSTLTTTSSSPSAPTTSVSNIDSTSTIANATSSLDDVPTSTTLSSAVAAPSTLAPVFDSPTASTPVLPTSSVLPIATAESNTSSSTHKTTTVAVSVTVIVVAGVVIATIAGLWWWKRRKQRKERGEMEDEQDYLAASW